MMEQNIKNNELQERLTYVPASVKVIEVTAHTIICQSGIEPPVYPGESL